jgi:hypothetical protein
MISNAVTLTVGIAPSCDCLPAKELIEGMGKNAGMVLILKV